MKCLLEVTAIEHPGSLLKCEPHFRSEERRMNTQLQKPYSGGFRGKTHYFALRVYIEDTDLGGVVYYANYLRFLERARSDMLRCVGIDQRAGIENRKGVYAVVEARIKYRKSAKLDDELVILSQLEQIRGVSCVISQRIVRGTELIADAVITAAFLTADGRPSRQPPEWVEKFETIKVSQVEPPPTGPTGHR